MNWFKSVVGLGGIAALVVLGWQARETRREVTALAARLDAPPAVAPAVLPPAVAPRLASDYLLEAPDVVELRFQPGADANVVALFGGKKFAVGPDGTIGLEPLGRLTVAGATVTRAERLVQELLGMADVTLKVASVNSKWYYVIADFNATGEQVVRVPCTGNETVLDALDSSGVVQKLPAKHVNVWVSRPTPNQGDQILPVDYRGITQSGRTRTNYQLLPGDRVHVKTVN